MLRKTHILIVALLLLLPLSLHAELRRSGGKVWSNKMNHRGLYIRNLGNSPQSFSVKIAPLYYSGDVELPGNVFTGYADHSANPYTSVPGVNGFLASTGFGVGAVYTFQAHPNLALRAQLMGGMLRGHAEFTRPRYGSSGRNSTNYFLRDFRSAFVEYGIGMEIYPSTNAGFYFYLGVSGATSFIHRDLRSLTTNGITTSTNIADFTPVVTLPESEQFMISTVPIIPVGIGYKWRIKHLRLGLEFTIHPTLIDNETQTLDGWVAGSVIQSGQPKPKTKGDIWTDSFTELSFSIGFMVP